MKTFLILTCGGTVTDLVPASISDTSLIKHEKIKEVLVAIWCTDKNQCDEKWCSLAQCILDFDDELNKGRITFVSKNRPSNPDIIKADDIGEVNTTVKEEGGGEIEKNIFNDIIGHRSSVLNTGAALHIYQR